MDFHCVDGGNFSLFHKIVVSSPINDLNTDTLQPAGVEQDSAEELESDVSLVTMEEDPFANCEKNLLEHIMNMQDKLEERLDLVEEQVVGMLRVIVYNPLDPK